MSAREFVLLLKVTEVVWYDYNMFILAYNYHESSSNNCVRSDQGHDVVCNLCVYLSMFVCYQISQVSNMTAIETYNFPLLIAIHCYSAT